MFIIIDTASKILQVASDIGRFHLSVNVRTEKVEATLISHRIIPITLSDVHFRIISSATVWTQWETFEVL